MCDEEESGESDSDSFHFDGAFGKHHPLLMPTIIQEVFGYLSFDRLKICRLVCQNWEHEAYKCMRGRTLVRITNYKRLKDYLFSFENRKDFCDCFEIGKSLNVGAPLMETFFNSYGSSIQSLALERTKWKEDQLNDLVFNKLVNLTSLTLDCDCLVPRGDDAGRYFQSQLPTQLLKLKYLNIDAHACESNFDIHPASKMKTFLIDLFSVAPNLETVSTPKSDLNDQPEFLFPMDPFHVNHFINGEVLDALDELNGMGFESNIRRVLFDALASNDQNSPKLPNLAELDVSMTLREEHIRKLQIKAYPLQRLDITITQNVPMVTLHTFLAGLGETLQSLTLRFLSRSVCSQDFPSAPDLKNLKSLKITGYKGSLQFIQNFSKLESLIVVKIPRLSTAFPTTEIDFIAPLQKMRALEILEVERLNTTASRCQLIRKWATYFPNLKKFRLDNINDGILQSIYSEMTGLEELIARVGDFTDSGLSGIPAEECEALLESNNFDTYFNDDIQPLSSIFSLKELRRLEVGSKKLTDVGIIFGITKCNRLQHLSIITYGMTDRSLRRIVETMNLDSLKTELCNQLTVDEVKYCLDKLNGCDLSINEYEGPMKSTDMWKFLKRYNNLKVVVSKLPVVAL